ncbi:NUDIX hydrolase [Bacillus benzoevorans]|uniref:8-oxo-dGTP diphosphatase n=1 Tax=Bacillus benzoevorans TaxID=1456 RepID=A0A7X0HTD0_9BACI|nr:NUDIX domain-containing protein [Bacillus benzoevorans]MBB6445385.1 8-oxo-dGTP diphosphatase [Bacillus benzoevorans]
MTIPSYKLSVAICVLNKKGEILLVKNKIRGWEFPGGYVDYGETIGEAAVREVKEETGTDIRLTRFLGFEQNIEKQTLISIFEGVHLRGELKKSNETLDVGYFSETLAQQKITRPVYKERIRRCLNPAMIPFSIYYINN